MDNRPGYGEKSSSWVKHERPDHEALVRRLEFCRTSFRDSRALEEERIFTDSELSKLRNAIMDRLVRNTLHAEILFSKPHGLINDGRLDIEHRYPGCVFHDPNMTEKDITLINNALAKCKEKKFLVPPGDNAPYKSRIINAPIIEIGGDQQVQVTFYYFRSNGSLVDNRSGGVGWAFVTKHDPNVRATFLNLARGRSDPGYANSVYLRYEQYAFLYARDALMALNPAVAPFLDVSVTRIPLETSKRPLRESLVVVDVPNGGITLVEEAFSKATPSPKVFVCRPDSQDESNRSRYRLLTSSESAFSNFSLVCGSESEHVISLRATCNEPYVGMINKTYWMQRGKPEPVL